MNPADVDAAMAEASKRWGHFRHWMLPVLLNGAADLFDDVRPSCEYSDDELGKMMGDSEALDYWCAGMGGDVDAAVSAIKLTPNAFRARMTCIAYRQEMPKPAFRAVLQSCWDHDRAWLTREVDRLGGDDGYGAQSGLGDAWDDQLGDLFRWADFPVDHLPEPVTVWRGTPLPDSLEPIHAVDYAWTRREPLAHWFAQRDLRLGTRPVVVKTTIPRADILAHINTRQEDEVVVHWQNLHLDKVAFVPFDPELAARDDARDDR